MGGERTRARKHVYVCIACLIVLALFGCSSLPQVKRHLEKSQQFVQAGNFNSALLENEKVLQLRGDSPPADRALFNIALIYADQTNPNRNPRRALEYFDRLEVNHPGSPYAQFASVLRPLVEKNEKLTREVARRRLMLKRAWDDNRKITELLEKHNVAIERSEKEKQKLNEELEKLNQILLESKQVDIEIEAKKRQATQ